MTDRDDGLTAPTLSDLPDSGRIGRERLMYLSDIAERHQSDGGVGNASADHVGRLSETHDVGHVFRSRPHPEFLATAVE